MLNGVQVMQMAVVVYGRAADEWTTVDMFLYDWSRLLSRRRPPHTSPFFEVFEVLFSSFFSYRHLTRNDFLQRRSTADREKLASCTGSSQCSKWWCLCFDLSILWQLDREQGRSRSRRLKEVDDEEEEGASTKKLSRERGGHPEVQEQEAIN